MAIGRRFRKPWFAMPEQSERDAAGECLPARADGHIGFYTFFNTFFPCKALCQYV
jgi:hypothetical protein